MKLFTELYFNNLIIDWSNLVSEQVRKYVKNMYYLLYNYKYFRR